MDLIFLICHEKPPSLFSPPSSTSLTFRYRCCGYRVRPTMLSTRAKEMCLISLQPWPHLAAQPTRPGESFCLIFQSGEHILCDHIGRFCSRTPGGGDTGRGPKKRSLDSEIKIRLQLTYLVVNLLHLICYLWNWEKEIINEVINKQSISAKPQSGRVGRDCNCLQDWPQSVCVFVSRNAPFCGRAYL